MKQLSRQTVVDAILDATTVADGETAHQLRDQWIQLHPTDFGVLDAARSLEKVAQILGMPDRSFKPVDDSRISE